MVQLDTSAAAPHIEIRDSHTRDPHGSGVFATKSFALGEPVIAVNAPLITALDKERLIDTCYQCLRRQGDVPYEAHLGFPADAIGNGGGGEVDEVKLSRCAGCRVVRYCGKACQKSSWTSHHSLECSLFAAVFPDVLPNHIRAVLRLLLQRKAGKIADSDWKSLMTCVSHAEELERPDQKVELAKLKSMAKMVGNFAGAIADENQVLSLLMRLKFNSLTLQTPFLDPLGLALHPLLAKINHSCNPNAYIRFPPTKFIGSPSKTATKPTNPIILALLRPVSTNCELTISYIDETLPVQHRQKSLQTQYFFTCRCEKCTTALQMTHAPRVPPHLQASVGTQLDALDRLALTAPQRIRALRAIFPRLLRWRFNIYPFPQMLNSLILAHLDAGHYAEALRLALARHFLVTANLFGAAHPFGPAHPVVLTHAFVVVRLMGLFADMGGESGSGRGQGMLSSTDAATAPSTTQLETQAHADLQRNLDVSYWLPQVIAEFLENASRTWRAPGERWAEMYAVVERNVQVEGREEREERRREMERWCHSVLSGVLKGKE